VILSGIVGMVLATLIRLEFAYPGVGIFVGDSLQYLSLASAHGVVMVFFMIMPLLFGAFANFLLPTQLGVHDVAFPRLNSAAFWFLPGGLLMLCQLVCVDRRYQRMNCFNIREIQSILKKRFFVDLINTHDHHNTLNTIIAGLRYKTETVNNTNSNIYLFYNYGIQFDPKIRIVDFFEAPDHKFINAFNDLNVLTFKFANFFLNFNIFYYSVSLYFSMIASFKNSFNKFLTAVSRLFLFYDSLSFAEITNYKNLQKYSHYEYVVNYLKQLLIEIINFNPITFVISSIKR